TPNDPSAEIYENGGVTHGPLIWPTVNEKGVTRTKKYAELSAAEKIQANYDMKATNIILQCIPFDIYSLVNHHRVAKDLWERVQLLMQGFAVPVFSLGDDPIACEGHMARQCTQPKRPRNVAWYKDKAMLAEAQEAGQILDEEQLTEDLDTYDSDCDDISNAKAVLMANISNYGSDIILEVPYSKTYLNDMENQSVHAMHDFKQSLVVDFIDNEIHSDSNIILYSQYLQETQLTTVQDTTL
ncbi:hypothetical protein Tco_0964678, partial [Tanacetum coccineum]